MTWKNIFNYFLSVEHLGRIYCQKNAMWLLRKESNEIQHAFTKRSCQTHQILKIGFLGDKIIAGNILISVKILREKFRYSD